MKLLLIILISVGLYSCEAADDNGKKARFGIQILEIGGCQYVVYLNNSGGGTAMIHHGACSNPIHKQLKTN